MTRLDLDGPHVDVIETTAPVIRYWLGVSEDPSGDAVDKFADELQDMLDAAQGAVHGGDVERVHYVVIAVKTGV
jgi:hypothetical protein